VASTLNAATFWIAFTFGAHIMMVNLSIGLSPLMVYYRNKAVGDKRFEGVARTLARFYAATYGVAGVFGTAYTVFLLSFYPKFIGLAGHIALIPFAIAILMIALHFLMLALYWYGWDRWSLTTHNIIGALLVISVLLIPLGFRAVFSFLNVPTGLHFDAASGKFYLSVSEFLRHNPTFWWLYLKSIVAAFTATFVAVAGGYAYKYLRSEGEEKEVALEVSTKMVRLALIGLVLMFFLGLAYALSLRAVHYKFNNIFGGFGWKVGSGQVAYNFSWLFALKMIFYVFQIVAVVAAYRAISSGSGLSEGQAKMLLYAGFVALATIAAGEFLNAFSQYPYFIAALGDVNENSVAGQTIANLISEIPANQRAEVVSYLLNVLNLENVNQIAVLPGVTALTIAFLAFLVPSAIYFIYMLLKPSK